MYEEYFRLALEMYEMLSLQMIQLVSVLHSYPATSIILWDKRAGGEMKRIAPEPTTPLRAAES
jgi:hypothetical protein